MRINVTPLATCRSLLIAPVNKSLISTVLWIPVNVIKIPRLSAVYLQQDDRQWKDVAATDYGNYSTGIYLNKIFPLLVAPTPAVVRRLLCREIIAGSSQTGKSAGLSQLL